MTRSGADTPRQVVHLTGSWEFYGSEQAIVALARHADTLQSHPMVGCQYGWLGACHADQL
jgi:hypothetical protein